MQDRAERVTVNLRIKLKYADRDTFEARFAKNISNTGIFVRTKKPVPMGTKVRFEYRLADGTAVLRGTGTVCWIRETDADTSESPAGMGIAFDEIDHSSRGLVEHIVETYGAGTNAPTPQIDTDAVRTDASLDNDNPKAPPRPGAIQANTSIAPTTTLLDFTGMAPRLLNPSGDITTIPPTFEERDGQFVLTDEGFIIPEPLLWAGRPGMVAASLHGTGLPVVADGAAHRWCPGGAATAQDAENSTHPTTALPEILAASVEGLLLSADADAGLAFLVPPIADDRARQRLVQVADRLNITPAPIIDAAGLLAGAETALVVQLGHFASAIELYENSALKAHRVLGGSGTFSLSKQLTLRAELAMMREHGIDVNDDPSLRDALVEQIEENRRTSSGGAAWVVTIAGAEIEIPSQSVFEFAGAELRRIAGEALDISAIAANPPNSIYLVYSDGPWPGLHSIFSGTFGPEAKVEELGVDAFADKR